MTVTHFKGKRVTMTRTHFFKDESFNNQATKSQFMRPKNEFRRVFFFAVTTTRTT